MILGHQKQWELLKKSAEQKRISHAYLFSGQSQLGKKTVALEFIKLLFCQGAPHHFSSSSSTQKSSIKSDGGCRSCTDLQKGIHPDFFLVAPQKPAKAFTQGSKAEIKISQIRDLTWKLSLHPSFAPLKAALIDDAHSLNSEAQNSLLKTLEEPKGEALLILVTDHPQLLFSTILSRVQNIRFFPVPKSEIENYLQENGVSLKKTQTINSLSFGKPGLAINFLKNPQAIHTQDQKIKDIIRLSKSGLSSRFQYAKNLVSQKDNPKDVLDIWVRYFRGVLLEKAQNPSGVPPAARLAKGGSSYSLTKLRKIIEIIERVNFLIERTNINQRLALEQIMLEL